MLVALLSMKQHHTQPDGDIPGGGFQTTLNMFHLQGGASAGLELRKEKKESSGH